MQCVENTTSKENDDSSTRSDLTTFYRQKKNYSDGHALGEAVARFVYQMALGYKYDGTYRARDAISLHTFGLLAVSRSIR